MATIYKKTYTKLLPPNAEVFSRKGERFARWKDGASPPEGGSYQGAHGTWQTWKR